MKTKQRGRPPGQKNKSKFIGVKLKDLNNLFSSEATIQISSDYSKFFNINSLEVNEVLPAKSNEKPKADIKVFDFNN
jgi:hypothetical protein